MHKYISSLFVIGGLTAFGATSMSEGSFAGGANTSVSAFIEGPNNRSIQTGGAYLIRDRAAGTVRVGPQQSVAATVVPQNDESIHINVVGLGHNFTLTPTHLIADNEYFILLPDGTDVWFWTRSGTWDDV